MKHRSMSIAVAAIGVCMSGCTTLGTNVNGSFRCDAPDGVCAPSTVIDDSAIARIEETSSSDLLNPVGPFQMDDGIEAPIHNAVVADAAAVARSSPSYELAVVFPGYTDATGTVHARRVVTTDALLPGRGDAMDAIAMRGEQPSRNRGLLAAAESAPPYLAIAPGVLAGSDEAAVQIASATSGNAVAEIEAKVSQRLSAHQRSRRSAPGFPGTVE